MKKSPNTLAVIPARGGSKGIPRKNTRILNGKPLIAHSIEKALDTELVDKVVLTTDDKEIERIGRSFKADEVINRPENLSTDEVPLAPVMKHALEEQETEYDYIICFQPTTPLIETGSIEKGIGKIDSNPEECLIFISKDTEHYWKGSSKNKKLLTGSRENRQLLEPIYQEIGVFISSQELIENGNRIDNQPLFQKVSQKEGIDIDEYSDWMLAELEANRKKIVYRCIGDEKSGLGHISRGITLAKRIFEHDLEFLIKEDQKLAKNLLEKNNLEYTLFENEDHFQEIIEKKEPDILVNDVLDTNEDYIQNLKDKELRVVNFEDMGNGASKSDAVINALYERSSSAENEFYGSDYICLRDEFRYAERKTEINSVERVMISYGGVDENNLTLQTIKAIENSDTETSEMPMFDIILGLGYEQKEELRSYLQDSKLDYKISQNIDWISDHMSKADLLFTSNGRTVYEAASLNLPMISISQNTREIKHLFSHYNNGILNLGLATDVSGEQIGEEFDKFRRDEDRREEMLNSLRQEKLTTGIENVKEIILGEK